MAGDWIPVRCNLPEDPAVIAIAAATSLDEFAVVGRLLKLWAWANQHTTDGNARGVTESWVDRQVGVSGFAAAMSAARWLLIDAGGVIFPKFDAWNSKNAKQRALTARRVACHKLKGNAPGNAPGNGASVSDALPTEQNRTEKEKTPLPPAPAGGGAGGGSEVKTDDADPKPKKPRKPKPHPERDPLFLKFWEAWPKKIAKPPAARAFQKLDADEALLDLILAGVARWSKSPQWTKDRGEFIPYPATWLNARQWEDEVGGPPAPKKDHAKATRELREREARLRAESAPPTLVLGMLAGIAKVPPAEAPRSSG